MDEAYDRTSENVLMEISVMKVAWEGNSKLQHAYVGSVGLLIKLMEKESAV